MRIVFMALREYQIRYKITVGFVVSLWHFGDENLCITDTTYIQNFKILFCKIESDQYKVDQRSWNAMHIECKVSGRKFIDPQHM